MNEIEMTLNEIERNFGTSIAKRCEKMKGGDIREFHTATFEGIIVRCESSFFGKSYHVRGEFLQEEALVLDEKIEEDMGMGM